MLSVPFHPGRLETIVLSRFAVSSVAQYKTWSKAYASEHVLLISSLTCLHDDEAFIYFLLLTRENLFRKRLC